MYNILIIDDDLDILSILTRWLSSNSQWKITACHDPADAIAQLNKIRTRAGLASLDATTLTSSAAINEAIHNERRLELAFEVHRWFDLTRTGTAQAAIGQSFGNEYYLFPVPLSEILVSSGVITQNAGY